MQRLKSVRFAVATLGLCLSSASSAVMLPAVVESAIGLDLGNQQPGRIAQTNDPRQAEADRLLQQGLQQYHASQYEAALKSWQQALEIYRSLQDRDGEATALMNSGSAYRLLSQHDNAIAHYQQALAIFQQLKNHKDAAGILNNLGIVYNSLAQYEKAITHYQQAVSIFQQLKDPAGEAMALVNLGNAYGSLSQYEKAIAYSQQALSLSEQIKDSNHKAGALVNLGNAYRFLSQYDKAIAYYQQALPLFQQIKHHDGTARTLTNLGVIYGILAQYPKAISFHHTALVLFQRVKNQDGVAQALTNLGAAHGALSEHQKEIAYYQQALSVFQQIKNRKGEAMTLLNLGVAYGALSQYEKAIAQYQQALPIFQQIKDRNGEAHALMQMGNAYWDFSQYDKALSYYQHALPLYQQVKDREGKGVLLNNLGLLMQRQKQLELAIVFYKQSVNVRETIRHDLRPLSRDLQESYTQTVAGTYRRLADLLIEQGRIGEAQQVLERLKIQEINDFTKGTRTATTVPDMGFTTTETQIKTKHNTLIAFGGKFYECEQSRCPQLGELREQYRNLSKEFQDFVEEIKKQLREGRLVAVDKATDDFQKSADRVVTAHPNSILIYPLVLSDKTRLLWAGKGGVLSKTAVCPLGEKALYAKVAQFREWLSKPGSDTQLKAVGKELYDCLVKPLEGELTANGIKHLIFVPDRATNYIPMAALYDGQQYLIERYAVSTVLSAGLTDTDSRLPTQPQQVPVLGLGLSEARGNFSALPNVITELRAIIKTKNQEEGLFPGLKFLNQAFDRNALENNLRGHKVLHIATHGEFKPSNPRDSYFLLGNGTPYAIPDIQTLRDLRDVHLVVLSACETGLGGADSLGLEVAGISSFFLGDRDRAKAVMASLWLVNDASTSLLMQEFYKNLATGQLSKAEALRQAQLEFLQAKLTAKDAPQRSDLIATGSGRSEGHQSPANFAHPYYWAPFILIGNSL